MINTLPHFKVIVERSINFVGYLEKLVDVRIRLQGRINSAKVRYFHHMWQERAITQCPGCLTTILQKGNTSINNSRIFITFLSLGIGAACFFCQSIENVRFSTHVKLALPQPLSHAINVLVLSNFIFQKLCRKRLPETGINIK